ncbi:TerD family protein [Methylobacterium sp. 37f]|uniref:TerD family protein n=1 Tax=Methylobacterium sp. 37f TaxID=2817058 RepID=UPI001FFC9953|nr:TerD family protein [Methylobacterium sp. 37f]MCK2055266.1 TerD family protein [Methylobacterium sp. 37f]
MPVNLSKGGTVSLSKEAPGLAAILAGLGWDNRVSDGKPFDLDASVFLIGADGKCANDAAFIFYNNKKSTDGSVEHMGDNTTGQGDGDDEVVKVDLAKVPETITRLVFAVTIHEAKERGQNFGQVQNAYIRVVNQAGSAELAKYDLSEDASTETAMVFGEVYRHNGEWKFKAVGQGFAGGLGDVARSFGINV